VGVLTVANGVGAVLSVVQGILVARWLGPELYGVAALVMSFPALVYTFFDARSAEASVKYLSEFHARGERGRVLALCKAGYAVDLLVATIAFLGVLVAAPWAASNIVHNPSTAWLIFVYAVAFLPRAFVGTSYAVLATLGRFSLVALIQALTTLLQVVLVLTLVVAGWGVAGVVWGNAIAMAVTGLLYGAVAYGLVQRTWNASWLRGDWRVLKGRRREIVSFLAYNYLNALLGMIPKQLDMVFLGYFRNPTEAGYYKLAKSLVGTVGYLVGPLQSVTYPKLARLWGLGNQKELRQTIRRLALGIGAPLGLVVLLGIAFVPFVVLQLVGDAYRPAILATQILLVGSAVWLTLFWLRPTYSAQGRLRQWLFISIIVVVLSIAVYPFVIRQWGYIGLAIWLGIMQLLGHSIAAWKVWK
jgi:O-antigen/teichoic acid export membrane protein